MTLDFTNSSNPWKFPTSYQKDGKTYNYTYNGYTITMQAPEGQSCIMFSNESKHYFLQCNSKGINLTLPKFDFDVTKIVLELYNPTNVTNNIYVNDKNVSTAVNANSQNPVTCTFDIVQDYQKAGYVYTIKNTGTSRIQKIKIYKSTDSRKDAGISFANNTYTVDFAKGKFEGAKLNNPNKLQVSYTILPEKKGTSIDNNGVVTFAKGVEATYTVTAKFAGNVTYKPATATYTLNVVDPNLQTRIIEFVAGEDKGNKGKSDSFTEGDIIEKDGISVNCDKARLGCTSKEGYRIYKDGLLTISTKIGDITKITFDDLGTADDLPNNLEPESGNYDKVNYVWTGKGKSIRFKVNVKAFLSKITVTVKVPVAKDYTLDENSVNTIEAYENANVTLKRTFYKDGEWNTLCLPFAVADAKTAFDRAELREVDTEKSNGNTIVFKKATAIEAGKPYLIKWANSSAAAVNVEKKFEGVTLVAAATPVEVNNGGISFNGFYKMTEASELGAFVAAIGAGNKLFKVTEGKMKGFRAAFVLASGAEATKYKVVIDGTATGIEDLVIDGVKANGRVYNLNGQFVGNSLNGLQPGLYIQNGKKIVVK